VRYQDQRCRLVSVEGEGGGRGIKGNSKIIAIA